MDLEGSHQQARPWAELGSIRVHHPAGMESVGGGCRMLQVINRIPGLWPSPRDLPGPSWGRGPRRKVPLSKWERAGPVGQLEASWLVADSVSPPTVHRPVCGQGADGADARGERRARVRRGGQQENHDGQEERGWTPAAQCSERRVCGRGGGGGNYTRAQRLWARGRVLADLPGLWSRSRRVHHGAGEQKSSRVP